MAQVEEDGAKDLSVTLKIDGKEYTLVLHDDQERLAVATEGWPAFVRASQPVSEN
jgi:cell division protein ZapA (FtsZ GTPase activity inhibitor)